MIIIIGHLKGGVAHLKLMAHCECEFEEKKQHNWSLAFTNQTQRKYTNIKLKEY